ARAAERRHSPPHRGGAAPADETDGLPHQHLARPARRRSGARARASGGVDRRGGAGCLRTRAPGRRGSGRPSERGAHAPHRQRRAGDPRDHRRHRRGEHPGLCPGRAAAERVQSGGVRPVSPGSGDGGPDGWARGSGAVDYEARVDMGALRAARLARARRAMAEANLDAVLVWKEENVRYLTSLRPQVIAGKSGVLNGALLARDGGPVLFVSGGDRDRAEAVTATALDHVRPGARECEVAGEALRTLLRLGGEYPHVTTPFVASGERMAPPTRLATDKLIRNGDLVFVDIGAMSNGYFGDIGRTVVCGAPSAEQRRI